MIVPRWEGPMSLSLQELGEQIQAAREQKGLSQEALARSIEPPTNRSVVAHLEQGRRLPGPEVLTALAEHLAVPSKYWKAFLDETYQRRLAFEEALMELAGRVVSLRAHDEHTTAVANDAVLGLFTVVRTPDQAFDAFNSVLVFYDVPQCTRAFFDRYFGADAIRSPADFMKSVRRYQRDAIRLFSTFEEAHAQLATSTRLEDLLAPIAAGKDAAYRLRAPWDVIEVIPDERLPDLGYISAERARQEHDERRALATFLRDLAADIATSGKGVLSNYTEKRKRKMDSLLRKFNSNIQHGFLSPLFAPDPDALQREADFLAPKLASDLERMADTQATAQRNLARYLAADHLDVYVATSMRSDADFVSVNSFCNELFGHATIEPLRLRHFNPTQSWIEDRVAKGLVEALMLRRSSITLYMAQKSDTFGKDSEASVALGQGKPVVVYVPRLHIADLLDTATLGAKSRADLQELVAREGGDEDREPDETMDAQSLLARLVTIRLGAASDSTLTGAVRAHWADFDLYGETGRIPEPERAAYRSWLDAVIRRGQDEGPSEAVRGHFVGILVATAVAFERRARTFREQHPLALQVILSTGVLNGILVTRSVDSCATLLRSLVRNEIEFDLDIDDDNYRLVEKTTRSTMRVISRHNLIANAFTAFYKTAS